MAAEDAKPKSAERPLSTTTTDDGLVARIAAEMRGGGAPGQTMLAAFVAWAITVAPATFSRAADPYGRPFAIFALVTGVAGPLLRRSRPELGRHLGISAFLAFATLSWLFASPAIQPVRLEPLRAAVGAIAWGAYALSWRERWDEGEGKPEPKRDPDAPLLQARATLPRGAIPIAAIAIAAALVTLILAWNVRDADRALAAQAIAVACAIGVITVAATVAVERGKRSSRGSRRFTAPAVKALLVLVVFAVAGVAIVVLRGS
jgi:hypothetical protein